MFQTDLNMIVLTGILKREQLVFVEYDIWNEYFAEMQEHIIKNKETGKNTKKGVLGQSDR